MADFQSSKTAAEIEEVLTGALLYNAAQILTEGEKAFVREKIGATAQGEGIKIISHFDSLEELEAAVPKPNAGDAYSIGEVMPYNLYIYDFYHDSWVGHGPIRANDISARFAQNVVVAMSAWEEDTDVFPDYTYKASIPLAELTGNDFPIVAFSPSDAVGGKFCPICFAFDGYIEIWAQSVPDADITVPAITFILQETEGAETGNSTKGITNAGGGISNAGVATEHIADGAVTGEKIAINAVSNVFTGTLLASAWTATSWGGWQKVSFDGSGIITYSSPDAEIQHVEVGVDTGVFTLSQNADAIAVDEAWGSGIFRAIPVTDGVQFNFKEIPTIDIPVYAWVVNK
jgi:hypothetical protein